MRCLNRVTQFRGRGLDKNYVEKFWIKNIGNISVKRIAQERETETQLTHPRLTHLKKYARIYVLFDTLVISILDGNHGASWRSQTRGD